MSKIYDEYLKLKKKDSSKLYLFKSGKFYIFVGEDCDLINEYVVLKKTNFSKETLKCGFPEASLEQYLKVFKNHGLDIEVINKLPNESDQTQKNLIKKISDIDIENITPLQALKILNNLKEMLNE